MTDKYPEFKNAEYVEKLKSFTFYMSNFSILSCLCRCSRGDSQAKVQTFEEASGKVKQLFNLKALFDKTQHVDNDEILIDIENSSKPPKSREIKEVFDLWSNNGTIEARDLKPILKSMGRQLDKTDYQKMVARANNDKGGGQVLIDFQKFTKIL